MSSMVRQEYVLLSVFILGGIGMLFVLTEQNEIHRLQNQHYNSYLESQIEYGNVIMKDGIPYLINKRTD